MLHGEYYNYQQKGHYTRDWTEPKKVHPIYSYISEACVFSSLFITEFNPLWVIDSRATDYATKDSGTFIEFWWVPDGERWIYVGNNARISVKGIGTCKLVLRGGRTLLLHNILYAPSIRRDLVSVLVLLKLGFNWYFCDDIVRLCLGITFYGSGFVIDGFIVMDVDYIDFNNNTSFSLITSSHDQKNDVRSWHARLNHIG